MRNTILALVLSTGAALPAQFPCVGSASPPVSYLTCPCSDGTWSGHTYLGQGTAQIGTTSLIRYSPGGGDFTIFLVGLPNQVPIPVPPGIVACQSGASVRTLHLDPIASYTGSGTAETHYWLYLPADANLVGFTLAFQGLSHQAGFGSPPFFSSQVLGLTIQP